MSRHEVHEVGGQHPVEHIVTRAPNEYEIRAVIPLPRGAVASFIKEPPIKLYEIHKYSVTAFK